MGRWTKQAALAEIEHLIGEITALGNAKRMSAPHSRWLARTLRLLEQVFGKASRYYLSVGNLTWAHSGPMTVSAWNLQHGLEEQHQAAYLNQLDFALGMLQAARDELQASSLEQVYEGKNTPLETSGLLRVLHLVERKLRKVIRTAPEREREVQDAIENLFIGAEIPCSRESESIEYSSKNYIPDFTLAALDLALEVKLCKRSDREKELIAEINDDIAAYKTKYGNVLFAVYDVGHIRDTDRFAESLEEHAGVLVRVVKH